MPNYRNRPIEIEAHELTEDNLFEISEWCLGRLEDDDRISVPTTMGIMNARVGDFVARFENGTYMAFLPTVFNREFVLLPD